MAATEETGIGRQSKLPWSKAFEISYNSVRIRFARSIITASGIVLAITFLMATLVGGRTVNTMTSGIPAQIFAVKQEQGVQKAEALRQLDALTLDAGAKKRIKEALAENEFKSAHSALTAYLTEHPEASAGAAGLTARLDAAIALGEQLATLNRVRIKLLERGAAVLSEEQAAQGAVASATASPEFEESASRDRWLVALALLVAFVGIMNAMLMSVTERFREIGTMKCLGALNSFIVKLFLIESTMMGFLGTLFGVALGLGLSVIKILYDFGWLAWGYIPWDGITGAMGISLLSGTVLALLAAVLPAVHAARMEPVVAMRVDQ